MPEMLLRYAFGPFLLDPAERHLSDDGRPVVLYPKALDVLVLLVVRAGHLVTKDELLEAVWPGVIVEENALSVAVSRLRAALGEEGQGFIETVPGHGYRFIAPVAAHAALEADSLDAAERDASAGGPRLEDVFPTLTHRGDGVAPASTVRSHPVAAARSRPRRRSLLLGAGALALLAFCVVALVVRGGRADDAPAPATSDAHQPPAEALLAYRRGRTLWESRHGETMMEALTQFKRATALDPAFAAAYVGQAQVYAIGYGTELEAEAAIGRALDLDSTLAEAWATRGFIRAFQQWDWAGAEAAFTRARTLDSDDVTTLQWLASLRMVRRRLPEAEALLNRALALRPDYATLHADLCEVLYYRRAYTDALAACDRATALDSQHPMVGVHRFSLALAAPEGRADAARMLAGDERAPFDDFRRARYYARLSARDSALVYVERVVAERVFMAPFLNPDPLFDPLRDDPRWQAAMRRMGLE